MNQYNRIVILSEVLVDYLQLIVEEVLCAVRSGQAFRVEGGGGANDRTYYSAEQTLF